MRTNKRVSAIVFKDDKMLIIHRFKNGDEYWVIPGGGVEDEETIDQALVREVKEETCLDLVSSEQIGSSEQNEHHHYFFKCVLKEGEPSLGGPEKDNSSKDNVYILEWVPISKVKTLENIYPDSVKNYL